MSLKSIAPLIVALLVFSGIPVAASPGAPGAMQVSAGGDHTCVLLTNQSVRCYGENLSGQLVNSDTGNVSQIATLTSRTCLLFDDGNVDCTLSSQFDYQSGDAVAIDGGHNQICVLKSDGRADCWSSTSFGSFSIPRNVAISAGFDRACVLTNVGNVDCSGPSPQYSRQLGDAIAVSVGTTPCALLSNGNVECQSLADYTLGDATAIAAGTGFACVANTVGNVVCWGDNRRGQAAGYSGGDAVAVSANTDHACALTEDGNAVCWGDNSFGKSDPYLSSFDDPDSDDAGDPGGAADASDDPNNPTPLRAGETRGQGSVHPLLDPIDAYSFVVASDGSSTGSFVFFRATSLNLIDIVLTMIDPNGNTFVIDSEGALGKETFVTGSATPGVWRAVLSPSTTPKAPAPASWASEVTSGGFGWLTNANLDVSDDVYRIEVGCTPYCP